MQFVCKKPEFEAGFVATEPRQNGETKSFPKEKIRNFIMMRPLLCREAVPTNEIKHSTSNISISFVALKKNPEVEIYKILLF
jgi:hypothetical protein